VVLILSKCGNLTWLFSCTRDLHSQRHAGFIIYDCVSRQPIIGWQDVNRDRAVRAFYLRGYANMRVPTDHACDFGASDDPLAEGQVIKVRVADIPAWYIRLAKNGFRKGW